MRRGAGIDHNPDRRVRGAQRRDQIDPEAGVDHLHQIDLPAPDVLDDALGPGVLGQERIKMPGLPGAGRGQAGERGLRGVDRHQMLAEVSGR